MPRRFRVESSGIKKNLIEENEVSGECPLHKQALESTMSCNLRSIGWYVPEHNKAPVDLRVGHETSFLVLGVFHTRTHRRQVRVDKSPLQQNFFAFFAIRVLIFDIVFRCVFLLRC